MRVLVTGAAGLVGGAVARHAAENGHEVVRVWHSVRPAPLAGARDLRCDLEDHVSVASLPIDVGAVVHAAARIPAGVWSDHASAAANRNADRGLLQRYAGTDFAGRWVYVSSVALENPEMRSTSPYAMEKAEAEDFAAHSLMGRARSLRISSPYGAGMRHMNVLRRFAEAARSGQPITLLGSGDRTQDFVHADDIAAAALAAIDAPGGDPVVVASGEPVSMRELARMLIEITDSRSRIELADRPDPQDGFRADYDLRPALDALGWVPGIGLEAGLRRMLQAT